MTPTQARRAILTAFDWHGGGGSPFYRFASTRMVQSERHRAEVATEARACLVGASDADAKKLLALGRVVAAAPIGVELVPNDHVFSRTAP